MKVMRFKLFFVLFTGLAIIACSPPDATNEDGTIDTSKVYRWKMVTTWPPGFPVLQEGAERFAENLAEMSNGRLQVKVYAGGELIPALQTFDAVSQGTVEMGHGSAYYWAGKVPEAQFFSTVPFGMNPRGMNAWLYFWRRSGIMGQSLRTIQRQTFSAGQHRHSNGWLV